jgi:hypothetical protein
MTPLEFFEKHKIKYGNMPGAWRSEVESSDEVIAYAIVKGFDTLNWAMVFRSSKGRLRGMMNGWPADLSRTRKFMNALSVERYSIARKDRLAGIHVKEELDKAQLMEDI